MRLLNSFGPNPRMVRMFLLEKGIELESVEHDLLGAENRQEPYTRKNPGGQMPALELDDGTILAETTAICDYLEELHPTPALIGETPEQRAEARMWTRRVEQKITENIYNGFRFAEGLGLFKDRMRCLPDAADGIKAIARDGLQWLDPLLEGKQYLCGDRLTVGDLVLYCCADFAATAGQPVDDSLTNVKGLLARVAERPSAAASLHPGSEQVGLKG